MMAKLYGIGTGPGDWELMTLKAVRIIRECGVIAVPASGGRMNAAYDTATVSYTHLTLPTNSRV